MTGRLRRRLRLRIIFKFKGPVVHLWSGSSLGCSMALPWTFFAVRPSLSASSLKFSEAFLPVITPHKSAEFNTKILFIVLIASASVFFPLLQLPLGKINPDKWTSHGLRTCPDCKRSSLKNKTTLDHEQIDKREEYKHNSKCSPLNNTKIASEMMVKWWEHANSRKKESNSLLLLSCEGRLTD